MNKATKILMWVLGISIILILAWLWSGVSGFEYGKKVELSFSFIGSIIGGVTTLLAVYFTVRQTRQVQQENRHDNKKTKEIDNLKMQIEYSKNAFKHMYEYQVFLENLGYLLDKILRRTNYLSKENTNKNQEEIIDFANLKFEDEYAAMLKVEEILTNLDIEPKINEIYNKMEGYTKRILIESASIINVNINTNANELMAKLFESTEFIGDIILNNENIDKAKEMLKAEDSSVKLTIELLIYTQSNIQEHIEFCQSKINKLILS